MTNNVVKWLDKYFPVLFKENMPVWLTLIVSIAASGAAAWGTYILAPEINKKIQLDEAKSSHMTKTIENLNEEIVALSENVRRLNEALVNNQSKVPELRASCLDSVTKLQWLLIDLRVVLTSPEDRRAVEELSSAISDVKKSLDVAVDAHAQEKILDAMRPLAERTRDVLERLYIKAKLKAGT